MKKINVMQASYDKFTQEDVNEYHNDISRLMKQAQRKGNESVIELERKLCREDLYYLLVYALGLDIMYCSETETEVNFRPWLFNRCREVQADPDFHVDIWARGHFKSTIITLGKTIQDILINPEIAICIYSYNASTAKSFVGQIKSNLENSKIKEIFPDIIPDSTDTGKYIGEDPDGNEIRKKAKWSGQEFTVKRKTNRKEPTVSGYGLVNAQPTGKHFDLLVYDDVVTPDSVRTNEMNTYTFSQWQMSLNTASGEATKIRVIGTRYHLRDAYFRMLNPMYDEKGVEGGSRFTLRKYPCMDGTEPVLYTKEYIDDKRMSMMGYVFASQMMCEPQESSGFRFLEEWIPARMRQEDIRKNKDRYNFYIIVDPANTKKRSSDFTSMIVIATTSKKEYIIADIIYDKMIPSERRDKLFELVSAWTNSKAKPAVFYESNSMSADFYMINDMQREKRFFFQITAATTKPRIRPDSRIGGEPLKMQRIMALEPIFRMGRVIFCESTFHTNWEGNSVNTTQYVIDNEYMTFPYCDHDDFLDALSRIADLDTGPMLVFPDSTEYEAERKIRNRKRRGSVYDIDKNAFVPF